MLILKHGGSFDKQATRWLNEYYPDKFAEDKCFIVDIEQTYVTKKTTPEKFTSQLIITNSIKDIYLLVSEITQRHSLVVFANLLARELAEHHDKQIKVHVISSLNFDITFLIPPNKNSKNWQVYGVNPDNEIEHPTVAMLSKLAEKKLIWEGGDILDWMNSPQQTLSGVSYVWG